MQGNNGTASHGSDGGEGGRPTFDQVLWMALGSNPAKMTVSLRDHTGNAQLN
jgi:hypothetical protein